MAYPVIIQITAYAGDMELRYFCGSLRVSGNPRRTHA